jgi:hypothetical protein
MKKSTLIYGKLACLLLVFFTIKSFAQSPTDGLVMAKGYMCNVVSYQHNSWKEYWEGTLKRDNPNIGTFTGQNVMYMGAYGITENLNVMVGLPYVWTKADGSQHFDGQRGVQDFSLWLKYRALSKEIPLGTLSVFATAGASAPTSKYFVDMLPFAIGMGTKTASLRLIADYKTEKGFYVTGQTGYILKGYAYTDKDVNQVDGKLYYTHKVPVPDVADVTGRLGFRNDNIQTDFYIHRFQSLSGDDIRRQDMPQVTNNMSATSLGWFGKYTYITEKAGEFSVVAEVSKVWVGSNIGQTTSFIFGIQYAFQLTGKSK